jgi:hypothetical protein
MRIPRGELEMLETYCDDPDLALDFEQDVGVLVVRHRDSSAEV